MTVCNVNFERSSPARPVHLVPLSAQPLLGDHHPETEITKYFIKHVNNYQAWATVQNLTSLFWDIGSKKILIKIAHWDRKMPKEWYYATRKQV